MSSRPPFGFNVYGYASGNFGEAVVLRNTIRALLAGGHPVAVRSAQLTDGRTGHDDTYANLYITSEREQPYAINLFGSNPPVFKSWLSHEFRRIPFERRINVLLPAWELDVLPPVWVEVIEAMDVVLASSEFVAELIRREVPHVPLMRVYTAVYPPEVEPDRPRWGLTDEEIVFFSAFDVMSDMRRKNPWATIKAFQAAFPLGSQHPPVRLLIKMSNVTVDPRFAALVDELEAIVHADPRMRLIKEQLRYEEVLTLYASSDVFVSLHRAEGLGLVLMEAMSLGKPIITTGYSGSMDFTTPDNAALVDYTLVPVDAVHVDYFDERTGGGAKWAEPSIESAAQWMVRLACDAELRERIGSQAALDMDARRKKHLEGEAFNRLREFAGSYDLSGSTHRRRVRKLRAMRTRANVALLKRIPGALVRRARRLLVRLKASGPPA